MIFPLARVGPNQLEKTSSTFCNVTLHLSSAEMQMTSAAWPMADCHRLGS